MLEYTFETSLSVWCFWSFDVLTGVGWTSHTPQTVVSRLFASILSLLGILCTALLTATLCGASELDATEVWLIGSMQRRQAVQKKMEYAVRMIQSSYVLKRVVERRNAEGDSIGARLAVLRQTSAIQNNIRHFKRARLNSEPGMQVTNIKTLDGLVRSLQATISDMAGKVDSLVEVSGAPTKAANANRVLQGDSTITGLEDIDDADM